MWAFGMMQFAHKHLKNLQPLSFYKLLGSGKGNGFNPWPDYSVYGLLQVWETEADATNFFNNSELMIRYKKRSTEHWTLYMTPIKADGTWSGQNPFQVDSKNDPANARLAIITRARIKKSLLLKFWKYVPSSEKPLANNEGLIYTKGVGEVPLLQMATFSLWLNEEALQRFAYKSMEHRKAINLTRSLNWYDEEMFIRFRPFRSIGTWMGVDPLSASKRLK